MKTKGEREEKIDQFLAKLKAREDLPPEILNAVHDAVNDVQDIWAQVPDQIDRLIEQKGAA